MLQMLRHPSLIMCLIAITDVSTPCISTIFQTISTMQILTRVHTNPYTFFCFNRIEIYRKHLPSVLYLFGKQTQEELWQACL